jgi:hypothetical protein
MLLECFFLLDLYKRSNDFFSISGAKLRRENELATHFQQITDGLLKHSKIEQCRNQSDTAKRLILTLVYRMFLHKADGNFDVILPLWQRTADLLIGIEKFLDKQTSEEYVKFIF